MGRDTAESGAMGGSLVANAVRSPFVGKRKLVTLAVFLVAAIIGGGMALQRFSHPVVLTSEYYWLDEDEIRLTELPPWIHSDLRRQALRDASIELPLSILEPDLVVRMGEAFALNPWVAEVVQVTKHHPARVQVELRYRRPVAMVDLDRKLFPDGGLLPVDGSGVLLPTEEFSDQEAWGYPLVISIGTLPLGQVGQPWDDPRVTGSAEIAAALADDWKRLGLVSIVPSQHAIGDVINEEYTYTLYSRPNQEGTCVIWGRAPSTGFSAEVPVEEKVSRLVRYVEQYGSLEAPGGAQEIDLRDNKQILVMPRVAAKSEGASPR